MIPANSRARINISFGALLARVARLPKGVEHSLGDPFAEKKQGWHYFLVIVLVLCLVIWAILFAGY
jgi:hypothetical protein